jgi:hypothetical protein
MTSPPDESGPPRSASSGTDEFQVELHWPEGVPNGRPEAATPPASRSQPADGAAPFSAIPPPATASGIASHTALLTTVNALMEGVHDMVNSMSARLDALAVRSSTAQDAVVTEVENLTAEIGALKDELAQLRRRFAVRSKATAALVDGDQVEHIAAVVVARLLEVLETGDRGPTSVPE